MGYFYDNVLLLLTDIRSNFMIMECVNIGPDRYHNQLRNSKSGSNTNPVYSEFIPVT